MAFSLTSTVQIGAAVLRVVFSGTMPLSASRLGPRDSRNPTNWRLFGPAVVDVGEVRTVPSDPFSFDLICTAPVVAGLWVLTAENITTAAGDPLDANEIIFNASGPQPFFSVPSDQITSETALRQALNAALDGPGWQAFVAALGYSDEKVAQLGKAAFYQRLLATASGEYLERLTTAFGVDKPPNVRMSDDVLRTLTIGVNNNKVNATGLEAVLLAYYGLDATVAHAQSGMPETFALADGDDLRFVIDDTSVIVVFHDDDFAAISQATATEVSAVINRELWLLGIRAFAMASTDPETGLIYLRIYSGLNGIRGRMKFTGGDAMRAFRFPDIVGTTQTIGTEWSLAPSTVSNGVPVGHVRLTWLGGTDPQLSVVFPDDYVNIYGAPFSAVNRGVFKVIATTPTSIDFEATGFEVLQSTITQTGAEDLFFVRPRVISLNGQYVAAVVGPAFDTAEILLPVTASAVERDEKTGWYLNGRQALQIDGTFADSGRLFGTTTVRLKTVGAHGLTPGRFFFLDEIAIDYTEDLGDVQENYSSVAGYIWTAVHLDDDRIMAIVDSETTPVTDNKYYFWDPITNAWDAGAAHPFTDDYPPALCKMADGRVFAIGMETWSIYDPETDIWTSPAASPESIPVPPYFSTVLMNNGKIFIAYSVGEGNNSAVFDPSDASWTSPNNYWVGNIINQTAVVIKTTGDIILAGGSEGGSPTAKTFYWRWINDEWEDNDDIPDPITEAQGVFVPRGPTGEAWFAGREGTTQSIQVFNPDSLLWTERPITQTPSADNPRALVAHSDQVYWIPSDSDLQWELHSTPTTRAIPDTTGPSDDNEKNRTWAFMLNDGRIWAAAWRDAEAGSTIAYMEFADERERSGGHLAGGLFKVTATLGPDVLEFETAESDAHTRVSGARLTPVLAELGTLHSGFMLNPKDGVAMADAQTLLNSDVNKGFVPQVITVGNAINFPDEPGYLIFGFGTARQSAPVRYLGIASSTQIRLDPNERLDFAYEPGETVTLLQGRGVYAPDISVPLGVTWLTDSSVGRIEAEKDLELTVAVGANIVNRVLYPGDRGLGNEGLPKSGVTKISDAVSIWGGDSYLAEAEEAREDV